MISAAGMLVLLTVPAATLLAQNSGMRIYGVHAVVNPKTALYVGEVELKQGGGFDNTGKLLVAGDWINEASAREIICVGEGGTVIVSRDGGATWEAEVSGTSEYLAKTALMDEMGSASACLAIAAGDAGTLIKSVDKGQTFQPMKSGTISDLKAVSVLDAQTAIAVGEVGLIRKTVDGGATFVTKPSPVGTPLNDIKFIDDSTGFIVCEGGTVLKTDDRGESFAIKAFAGTGALKSIDFDHHGCLGIAVGQLGAIMVTMDRGETFTVKPSATTATLRDVEVFNIREALIVGDNGTVLRTTDGGKTFVLDVPSTPYDMYAVKAINEESAVIAGEGGMIMVAEDKGTTLSAMPPSTGMDLSSVTACRTTMVKGKVEFVGGNQAIRGNTSTYFSTLVLRGGGIKSLKIGTFISNLDIGDRELATNSNTLTIMNTDANAVDATTGFVSTDNPGGALIRMTSGTDTYTFPVGSSDGPIRVRPVEVRPTTPGAQQYSVRMVNHSPSIDGFDVNTKDSAIMAVNNDYYHMVDRLQGTEPVDLTIYFDSQTESDFTGIAHWQGPPQWEDAAPFSMTATPPPGLSSVTVFDWNDFETTPFALSEGQFTDICGTFTIGGSNPNFNTIADAIAGLHRKRVTCDVVYKIRDGIYNDRIDLGNSVNYVKPDDSVGVYFVPENTAAPNIEIAGANNTINVVNRNNITFYGLKVKAGTSGTGVNIYNSSNINLYHIETTADGIGNIGAAFASSSDISLNAFRTSGYLTGLALTGGNSGIHIDNCSLAGFNLAISGTNPDSLILINSLLKTTTGQSVEVALFSEIYGNLTLSGNSIAGAGAGVTIGALHSSASIEGNVFNNSSLGLAINAFAQELKISNNEVTVMSGSGLEIGDAASPSMNNISGRSLNITRNSFIVSSTAVHIHDLKSSNILLLNNNLGEAKQGIALNNVGLSNVADVEQIRMLGNVAVSNGESCLKLSNVTQPSVIRSNTMVALTSPLVSSVLIENSNNLNFCANNMVNYTGANVVSFGGVRPTDITTGANNWYSFVSATVSNDESLILSTTDLKVDPKFKCDVLGSTGNQKYQLSYQSALLDLPISCGSQIVPLDILGNPRSVNFDVGAYESFTTSWDGLPIKFDLLNGVAFTAGGTGNFTDFKIDGLQNFSSVDLKVFGQKPDGTEEMVFETTSPTTFWDGTNMNTQQLVEASSYRYELTLDAKLIKGLVYVKR